MLVGDGLGHVAFAGVAAGYLLDISPVLTALVAVVGALAIELLRARGGAAGDQALALVFYTGIALGVVLVSGAGQLNVEPLPVPLRVDPHRDLDRSRGDRGARRLGLATVAALYRAAGGIVVDEGQRASPGYPSA